MLRQDLTGTRILITGASGGIAGAARAALEAAGATVTGIDVVPGPRVLATDVTDGAQVASAVAAAVAGMGGLDVLVNAAGIGEPQDAGAPPDAAARRIMDVNFFGAWNTTAAALPHLLAARGRVVNIASMLAAVDLPYASAYCASKRALDAWANVLRMEYGHRLRVVTVYPGYVRTSIHARSRELGAELEGMARAETLGDAAAAILAACTGRRDTVTFTRRSALELWLARHLPDLVRAAVLKRARTAFAARPRPAFLNAEAGL